MFYQDKKVLVTGGTGFIGTHLTQALLDQGARVRITVHQRPPRIDPDRVETVAGDLTRPEDCLKAVQKVDCLFHAAGANSGIGGQTSDPVVGVMNNLVMTAQVLDAARKAGVPRVLVFSSSTVYPVTDYPVKESDVNKGEPHLAYLGYGWMRRYFEKLSEYISAKTDTKIAIVRPTAVYGRWDNFSPETGHVIPSLVRKAIEKQDPYQIWGTGEEIRDFLHVADLARGCLLMLEKNVTANPVNIGYGQPAVIKEVARMILTAAGHEPAQIVYANNRPTGIPVRMVNTDKAKAILGFVPSVTLAAGLADTVDWYKTNRQQLT